MGLRPAKSHEKRWGRRFRLPTLDPSPSGWQAKATAPPTATLGKARKSTDDKKRSSVLRKPVCRKSGPCRVSIGRKEFEMAFRGVDYFSVDSLFSEEELMPPKT